MHREQLSMNSTGNNRLALFLQNVANTSKAISKAVAGCDLPVLTTPTYSTKPPALPRPPNVLPELEATGAPASIISEELERFSQDCRALRRQAKIALLNITQNMPDLSPFDKSTGARSARSVRILEEAYLKRVDGLKNLMLKRVCCISTKHSPKPAFKHEYTPLLEKYFRDNAFPSSADRAMLAQKTHMTLRQIEVWFQNHRRRAREDGKPLPRRSYDANPDDYTLESLQVTRSTPSRRSRSISTSPSDINDEDFGPLSNSNRANSIASVSRWISHSPVDIVKGPVPPHAFPTPFSPNHDNDPFPFKPSYAEFEWYRKATVVSKSAKKHTAVDIEAFQRDFQLQLRVFEKPEKSLKRKRSDDQVAKQSDDHSSTAHPVTESRSLAQCELVSLPTEAGQTRPTKRRLVQTPRRPSFTSVSCSSSRSFSGFSNRSSSVSSTSSASSIPFASTHSDLSYNPPAPSQHFFDQCLHWHTSKFADWSSIPPLTLNCIPLNIPF